MIYTCLPESAKQNERESQQRGDRRKKARRNQSTQKFEWSLR